MAEAPTTAEERIAVHCDACGRDWRVPASLAGHHGKCACGHVLIVPHADAPPGTIKCPHCGKWTRPEGWCEWCSEPLETPEPVPLPDVHQPLGHTATRPAAQPRGRLAVAYAFILGTILVGMLLLVGGMQGLFGEDVENGFFGLQFFLVMAGGGAAVVMAAGGQPRLVSESVRSFVRMLGVFGMFGGAGLAFLSFEFASWWLLLADGFSLAILAVATVLLLNRWLDGSAPTVVVPTLLWGNYEEYKDGHGYVHTREYLELEPWDGRPGTVNLEVNMRQLVMARSGPIELVVREGWLGFPYWEEMRPHGDGTAAS